MPINPYEPPPEVDRTPYWIRFRRALARAGRAYRAGLVRENISPGEHVRTWLAALGAAAIVLFMMVAVIYGLVTHYLV